jgi:ABC-type multidrug transport system, ATPase and permease components
MRDGLYDHIQKLPYEYHVKADTGDLIQRCTSDVDTIRRFFSRSVS